MQTNSDLSRTHCYSQRTKTSTLVWAGSALALGVLTAVMVTLEALIHTRLGLARPGIQIDILEGLCAAWFIIGSILVLSGNHAGRRVLMSAAGAAILMNFVDFLREMTPTNAMVQIVATVYCLFLLLHMRKEESCKPE